MRIPLFIFLLVVFVYIPIKDNESAIQNSINQTIAEEKERVWVDSIYNKLSDEERLGQLFMIRAHSDKGADYEAKVENIIIKHKVGGLCFFQGTPKRQAELTNRYNTKANLPLMIAMDAEWGLGMRFPKTNISFPKQLTLGAIQDNRLIYNMGKEIARQCRRLGVHVNFAPVLDINNNPNNPVINYRSFGEDRYNVTAKGFMYASGMQDYKVMACAKHFPGHGDTDVDSHYDLPVINHNLARLDSIEMYPFKVLAQHGLQSMMLGHLSIPALDNTKNQPSSLSPKIVTTLLKEKINYQGLLFTDGLGMKGVSKHYDAGEIEANALIAGNDILLLPQDVPAAMSQIKKAITEGRLSKDEVEKKVRKVLLAKYKLGLDRRLVVNANNLMNELNTPKAEVLRSELIKASMTLVRDPYGLVPFRRIDTLNFASLAVGSSSQTTFQKTLNKYATVSHYQTGKELSASSITSLVNRLKRFKVVFVSMHDMSSRASKNFGISSSTPALIKALAKHTKVIVVVFGNPYSLKYFDDAPIVLQAYEDNKLTQSLAAQGLFGAYAMNGKLPITASPNSTFGMGVPTEDMMRLGYEIPEAAGLNSKILNKIDGIAQEALRIKATPGCQILVARKGKVVYQKSFGYHDYSKKTSVKENDVFDLASVTKVAATTISLMKLHEEGKINIYSPISNHLSICKGTNKSNLIIRDILAHRAGLKAWIPFYSETLTKSKKPSSKIYKTSVQNKYQVEVARSLYMSTEYIDTVWARILDSDLRSTRNYKYSDLGFIMFSKMVQEVTGQTLDQYATQNFYRPLGLQIATFNPLKKFDKSRIVPSENDNYFRHQKIQGYVHDMGAAMLGGVSGHAGLFANSNDVAIIYQMMLNGGSYGGRQYFTPETVRSFTTRHESATRRGIGWDMKQLDASQTENIAPECSAETFGHLGFTGIGAWADPQNELIYIFISNRTYPSMNNWKLNKEDIRPRIQSVIYEALMPNG